MRLANRTEQLQWLESRHGGRLWDRWAVDHPALLCWSAVELLNPVSSPRTDAMQAALVQVAQNGDGEAAVLLLTQLAPGLHRICRWVAAVGYWPLEEAIPEVRAVFYETVYRHSLERRPTKIAANLVLDTRQRIQRAQRSSLASGQRHPEPIDQHCDPTDELTDDLAVLTTVRSAIAGLPGSYASRRLTADLAYRVWFLDQPRSKVAAELGIGDQAVSVRLHRLRSTIDRDQLRC